MQQKPHQLTLSQQSKVTGVSTKEVSEVVLLRQSKHRDANPVTPTILYTRSYLMDFRNSFIIAMNTKKALKFLLLKRDLIKEERDYIAEVLQQHLDTYHNTID
jgi:hypothetical protein